MKAEAAPYKIYLAVHPWMKDRLRFGVNADPNSSRIRYEVVNATRIDQTAWAQSGLLEAFTGTYSRDRAIGSSKLDLFRLGHPFMDFLEEQAAWDDLGRVYSLLRHETSWDSAPGTEWHGFRFYFNIEGDIEPMIEVG